MALRNIVVEGDPILRKRAKKIEKVGEKERIIFLDMLETMRDADGCGLAAPQVGLMKRMIVVELAERETEDLDEAASKTQEDEAASKTQEDEAASNTQEDEVASNTQEDEAPITDERKKIVYMLANPEIIHSEGSQIGSEGCLSVPGFTGKVERPLRIKLKGLDYDNNEVIIDAEGFFAVAISHEIDHLNGILFTDIASEIVDIEESKDFPEGEKEI